MREKKHSIFERFILHDLSIVSDGLPNPLQRNRLMHQINRTARHGFFGVLKSFSIAIGSILGFLCKCGPFLNEPIPTYGMPMATYRISGTISAEDTKQAIPGIRLTLKDTLLAGSGNPLDSAFADTAGKYTLEFSVWSGDSTWRLEARDVDGTLNGSFGPKDSIISVSKTSLTGASGSFDLGHAEKTVNISLDRNP
jgi:putative lipoprotein (rSAM/lipoprotein system)